VKKQNTKKRIGRKWKNKRERGGAR